MTATQDAPLNYTLLQFLLSAPEIDGWVRTGAGAPDYFTNFSPSVDGIYKIEYNFSGYAQGLSSSIGLIAIRATVNGVAIQEGGSWIGADIGVNLSAPLSGTFLLSLTASDILQFRAASSIPTGLLISGAQSQFPSSPATQSTAITITRVA